MKNNPYIGPRPYQRGERRSFYGRAREARDLLSLIRAERVALFYAQSGAGKTSLLNAQVIPTLEAEFNVLPSVRVGGDLPRGIAPEQVTNIFVYSALLGLAGQDVPPESLLPHSLLSFLRELCASGGQEPKPPILILDQFEEILTTHRDRWQEAQGFFLQLDEALRGMPTLGVVLALREDHLAGLDAYATLLPKRLRPRFRMELMKREDALDAIKKPALQAGCPFDDGVAEQLADDLSRIKLQRYGAEAKEQTVSGPYVEPVQLQVVCQQLWENLPEPLDPARRVITSADVAKYGNVDDALTGFYDSAVAQTVKEAGVSERTVRRWFSSQLITRMQTRGLVMRGESDTAGLPNAAVDRLEQRYLIRADVRAGARWYELAHDRLLEPVRERNAKWFEKNLSLLQRQAELWNSQSRPTGLLLRGKELAEAEAWAERADQLELWEGDFLAACRKAREQAERERRRNRLVRVLAVVATLAAIGAGVLGMLARQQANLGLSGKLAVEASTLPATRIDRSLLLSVLAYDTAPTTPAWGSLLTNLDKTAAVQFFLRGHTKPITALAFSPRPEQLTLASGGQDNTVRLWNLSEHKQIGQALIGHTAEVRALAFHPDGKLIASTGADSQLFLWNVGTLQRVAQKQLVSGDGWSLAFSPDGKFLAVGTGNGSIELYDAVTLEIIGSPLTGHAGPVQSLAFSARGQTLYSGGYDRKIKAWEVPSGSPLSEALAAGPVSTLATDALGQNVVSGDTAYHVDIWDDSGSALELIQTAPLAPTGRLLSVGFLPGGTLVYVGSNNDLTYWKYGDPQKMSKLLADYTGPIESAAFIQTKQGLLYASSSGDTIVVWTLDPNQQRPPGVNIVTPEKLDSVAISPDGKTLASGAVSGQVQFWNAETGEARGAPLNDPSAGKDGLEHDVLDVAFSPDGRLLASASADKSVRLWDVASGRLVGHPLNHGDRVWDVAFSPDGKQLASASDDGNVQLWNVSNGQLIGKAIQLASPVYGVAFSPDGKQLAVAAYDRTIHFIDISSRQPSGKLMGYTAAVEKVAFSLDSRWLAAATDDGRVWLRDRANKMGDPLTGHTDEVHDVGFSPDGKVLASTGNDGTLRLWDMETRQPIGEPLKGHTDFVWRLAFSKDGKHIVTAGKDGRIIVRTLAPAQLRALACQYAGRNLSKAEWALYVPNYVPYRKVCENLPTEN